MLLSWLATWGAMTLAGVALVVCVFLGVQLVRLDRRMDGLRACGLPVSTTFGKYLGRCVRRDEHSPDQCAWD
jgi:hypothetical protein